MISDLIQYEKALLSKGIELIAGVDEVGRGPLAGPFVAGAVVLDWSKILRNNDIISEIYSDKKNGYNCIKDSKKLTPNKREKLSEFLINSVVSYSIIEISVEELDDIGISETTQKAFYQCIERLSVKPQHVLTDNFEIKKIVREMQTNISGGDNKSLSIASASIIAKVYRDRLMKNMDNIYPQYNFSSNKGYGTKKHLDCIKKYGICPIHRKSFHPISSYLHEQNCM